MAYFIPQNIAMQKKKNRKFWTWRYSFLIDSNIIVPYPANASESRCDSPSLPNENLKILRTVLLSTVGTQKKLVF